MSSGIRYLVSWDGVASFVFFFALALGFAFGSGILRLGPSGIEAVWALEGRP